MARPDRHAPPPGYVLIRVEDLAGLTARHASTAPAPVPADPDGWEALSAVVATLTAGLDGGTGPGLAELAPEVPAETATGVALGIAAGYLRALGPRRGDPAHPRPDGRRPRRATRGHKDDRTATP